MHVHSVKFIISYFDLCLYNVKSERNQSEMTTFTVPQSIQSSDEENGIILFAVFI